MAPRCMAAASTRWNSGRLSSMIADRVAAADAERGQATGDPLDAVGVRGPGDLGRTVGCAQGDARGILGGGGALERLGQRAAGEGRMVLDRQLGGRHPSDANDGLAHAQDEPARGEVLDGVLEGGEVALREEVDRAAARPLRPHPAPQHGFAGALLGVGEQVEQDRQLGPVVELAGEQLQRAGVERADQLLVGEAEQVLQLLGARPGQKSWFSPPKTSDTESSVKIRRIESVSRSADRQDLDVVRRARAAAGSCP